MVHSGIPQQVFEVLIEKIPGWSTSLNIYKALYKLDNTTDSTYEKISSYFKCLNAEIWSNEGNATIYLSVIHFYE